MQKKYGFTDASPYPQPKGSMQMHMQLNGLEEEVAFLPGTSIRVWYTHLNTCYPFHYHRCMEIIECVHAEYLVHIECAEQETYRLTPNDILLIPGGVVHDLQPGQDCNGWIYLFDLTWLEMIPSFQELRDAFQNPILISKLKNPTLFARVGSLLSRMRNDYFSDNPMREVLFDSSLLRLLERVGNREEGQEAAEPDKRGEHDALFDEVMQYIDEHFADDLTLTGLSHRFNLSSAYFSRLFKKYTHDSFSSYLAARRFQEAERLLMDPEIPITVVASRCGYDNPAVFSRAFMTERKCSPTEFRHIYT